MTSPARRVARHVLNTEAAAIAALVEQLDEQFDQAVSAILDCAGRVIVSGIGKTGHIGRKLAATLASTGTPAYFVHAAEAAHGDLGMITPQDVVIALSHSGSSAELLTIVPLVKREGATLIAITGHADSPLAREASVHLSAAVSAEACPLNLAPTASTTAALALGDALALALLDARGFDSNDFARSHPGGALGRRLLTHVRDIMRSRDKVPSVAADCAFADALISMTQGGLGMTVIVDENDCVAGIFTDGDLRRAFEHGRIEAHTPIASLMTRTPHHIRADALAVEAATLMETHRISQLVVTDAAQKLLGALNTHDLMLARVI